ncbi:hypothetical protein [Desulfoluna spongiiphila]|uniref:Nicotinamidase-related amidase n=1 Tax=Desulfoluna spongiiphila TaxID=419481 RepID=A0A1G5EJB9_9BACT|nr:hypothetical protein [Desulfoluna spongiiphila]SCY27099.1 Nicotinamidase-related amidase [Desulfoluna spongiiphila]
MKRILLIIDPQNSFCDPTGELFVEGASRDMERLTDFIEMNGDAFSRVVVTLDSHNRMHIAHPAWWADRSGNPPAPFTAITADEVQSGHWRASNPEDQPWSQTYMEACGTHVIWPPHCLLGTWGHGVYHPLDTILSRWANRHTDLVMLPKGASRYTEHFSIFQPKVMREGDPASVFHRSLLDDLSGFDEIYVAGEASSHCVADSVRDLVSARPVLAERVVLLTDAMSPVAGFEHLSDAFFTDMATAGVRTATTTEDID